jgi:LysM repeat protein
LETTQIGALVSYGAYKYQVDGGKLRLIRTTAEYTALAQNRVAAVTISKTLFNLMPKGNPTSYVVVAGDSLSKVAAKFKTTKTVLRTLNNLSTEILQRGQVLVLP